MKRLLPYLISLVLLALGAPAPLSAQADPGDGRITGYVKDRVGTTASFDSTTVVCAVILPPQAPPFNEIVSAGWQEALDALVKQSESPAPFGALLASLKGVTAIHTIVAGDGFFRLEGLPLNRRIGVAARVAGVWRPLQREIRLTEDQPAAECEVPFWTLARDLSGLRISRHSLEISATINRNLRYAAVEILETIVLENPDPTRAVLPAGASRSKPFIKLGLLVSPGLTAAFLPSMYGSQLSFLQGRKAPEPRIVPVAEGRTSPWTFGGIEAMHGPREIYSEAAQTSHDSWHPLNARGELEFIGEGETLFISELSPDGRGSAWLIFNRPVPPARDGNPGRLVLRIRHKGGVLHESADRRLRLARRFPLPLTELRVTADPRLEIRGLKPEAHARIIGDARLTEGLNVYGVPEHEGDLIAADEEFELIIGFTPEARAEMAKIAGGFSTSENSPPPRPDAPAETGISTQAVFKALAVLFGLAFLVALVSSLRASREDQIKRLNRCHASSAQIVGEIHRLHAEYQAGRLPAALYTEQRKRLVNRLVEAEAAREKD